MSMQGVRLLLFPLDTHMLRGSTNPHLHAACPACYL